MILGIGTGLFWVAFAAALWSARRHTVFWPLLALGLLLGFNQACTPGFFSLEMRGGHLYGARIDILNEGAKVMLLGLGMTLVIATGGVDLSVGATMAIAGAVAAQAVVAAHLPAPVAVVLALGVSALAGAWNGLLVAVLRIPPIVATLILMVAGRGIAQLITGGQIITFTDPFLSFLGNGWLFGLPFTLTLVLAAFGLTALLTRKTALGLFIEAIGDSETASRFTGLPAPTVKFFVYVFSGLCAGLAGLVAAGNIRSADANHAGLYLELDAIIAAVVGGTSLTGGRFYLAGSLVGALLMQTLTTTLYALNVSADVATVPKALVILGACLLQSPPFRARLARLKPRRAS
jgi:ribose/xylose/arabinose/galactoside ABC-type transport system permease subunit